MSFRYSPKIVTDGLILYYDGANPQSYISGDTICNDLSLTQSTGTLTNGVTYDTDNNGSWVFDGIDDYIEAPINAAFDLDRLDPMSFECWVKFDSFDPTIDHLFAKYQFGLGIAFSIFGNQLRFDLQNNGTTNRITKYAVGTTILSGVWYHLAATYDGSSSASGVKMYVNSVEVSYGFTVDGLTGSIFNSQNLTIGAAPAIGFYVDANIANTKMWNKELSVSEVLQNYNTMKSRFK